MGEPFKEEKAVAKYLRFNCPTKSTNMMGHRVDYFIGRVTFNQRMVLLLLTLYWGGGVLFSLLVLYLASLGLTVWFLSYLGI